MTEESDQLQLANEAIQIEHHISELYMIFYSAFPEDSELWWKLAIEEKNHASLLRSGINDFMPKGLFPMEMIGPSLQDMQEINKKLVSWIDQYQNDPPSRETAFQVALEVENSAGEVHFQEAMEQPPRCQMMKLFQQLNQDDKDHAKRIQAYMEEKGIGTL